MRVPEPMLNIVIAWEAEPKTIWVAGVVTMERYLDVPATEPKFKSVLTKLIAIDYA